MLRLQSFNFRKSRYERPNQTWVCGREVREGAPCRPGPDRHGRCRATAECTPRRDGELWVCTRPKSAGGPCGDGPRPDGSCSHPLPPCQPVRTVRAKRGRVVRWTALATLALLVLALQGPTRDAVLSPGQLTAQHANVADCGGCHTTAASSDDPADWVRAAFDAPLPADHGDGAKCLSCHAMGEHPFNPHGAAKSRLAAITRTKANGDNGAATGGLTHPVGMQASRAVFGKPPQNGSGVTCATCHREHQGAMANLTAMDDARCQSCHETTFAGFTDGHPGFTQYPYNRRTRIQFTHVRHAKRHFPEAEHAPTRCGACHTPDSAGKTMQTAGFERTCAACHADDVRGTAAAGSPAVPVLTVPGLDVVTLRQRKAGIGHWPELSDRELTPFMKMLLADAPEVRAAIKRFEKLDPMDLRGASQRDIQAVQTVAWAVKRLMRDLVAKGPAGLRDALRAHLGKRVSDAALRDMTAGLPLATVRRAQETWFPDLATELAKHKAGKAVPMPGNAPSGTDGGDSGESGESGESGDSGGGILGGGSGGSSDGGGSGSNGDGADSSDSGGGILGGGSGGSSDGGSGSNGDGADSGDSGGGILGGGSGGSSDGGGSGGSSDGGGSGSNGDGADSGDSGGGILGGDSGKSGESGGDGGGGLLTGGGDGGTSAGAPEKNAEPSAKMPEPDPVAWSKLGGWYRDFFAISYRPSQHADRFLKRWMDVSAAASGGNGARFASALFDRLTREDAPGRCTKCHSVDARGGDRGPVVNWNAGDGVGDRGDPFTRFSHEPHLTQVASDQGCATCHRFAMKADYRASFDDRDPATFTSNFKPIAKGTCESCHTAEKAGNACTQCHRYHIDTARSSAMDTGMSASTGSP